MSEATTSTDEMTVTTALRWDRNQLRAGSAWLGTVFPRVDGTCAWILNGENTQIEPDDPTARAALLAAARAALSGALA